MIDPFNIRPPTSDMQAEELLVFCICAANSTSVLVAPRVDKLLSLDEDHYYPLDRIQIIDRRKGGLEAALKSVGIGCQSMKAKHLRNVMRAGMPRLQRLSFLEKAVGPKTARMWLLFMDPERMDIAVLDRHQLAWMRENGLPGAPESTPARGWPYKKWEFAYIEACRRRGLSVRHLDEQVWNERARRTRGEDEEAEG